MSQDINFLNHTFCSAVIFNNMVEAAGSSPDLCTMQFCKLYSGSFGASLGVEN